MTHREGLDVESRKRYNETAPADSEVAPTFKEANILAADSLAPLAKEMFEIINAASLEIKLTVSTKTKRSISYVWATPNRGIRTSSFDGTYIDLLPMATERIPQIISDLIVVRKPSQVGEAPISVSYETWQKATHTPDIEAAILLLTDGGLEENQAIRLMQFQGNEARRWSISSRWSTEDGDDTAGLEGVDSGLDGQWLVAHTGDEANPGQLSYSPVSQSDLTKALRTVFPRSWISRALRPMPANTAEFEF